jgi:N-acetyl-gamma-glutamyl-phosphate reductase
MPTSAQSGKTLPVQGQTARTKSVRVGVVGFRGYGGLELQRILGAHARVEPWLLEHRQDAAPELRPLGRAGAPRIPASAEAVSEAGLALVFLATPQEVSMELAPALLARDIRVVDLSGAFRLRTAENYQRWYKEPHTQPALLAEAVYGLPEFYRERVPGARLLANPGCYPTAANLALRPLLEAGVADRACGIVCDAKSGVSGAGRKAALKTSFCEVAGNLSAYSIFNHRHVPEVLQNSGLDEAEFSFTAQLVPIERGILETIYFRTRGGVSAEELLGVYQKAYAAEPFVRLYAPGSVPDLRGVHFTNFCDIGFSLDERSRRAVVVAAIDNLGKGAAGQAVQNMNLMLGFPETEGLA